MKIKSAFLLSAFAVIFTANSFAGVNNIIEIGTDSGVAGATVDIDLTWTEGGAAETDGLQFDVQYDNATLSFVSCTLNPPYDAYDLANCGPFGDDVRIGLIDDFVMPGPIPSGVLGTITFMIDGAATPGNYPLTFGPLVDTGNDPDPTTLIDGNVEVVDVPVPNYNSTPAPGGTIDFGTPVEGSGDVQEILNIENNGTAGGGSMDVTCSITNNPGGVYSLVSPMDGMFTLGIGENDNLTIACNTDVAGDYTGGTLSCDHTAPNAPDPATYTLDCLVTGDPVYGSSPPNGDPIAFGSFPQNNPAPDQTLLINNDAGEAGSILAGDCSLMGGGTPISLVGGPTVPYSVMQGAPDAMIVLSCDTTQAVGAYNDTLVCTNNDPALGMDATYPVSCEILPPDPGMWGSNPPSGSTINLTPGGPVVVGTDLTNAGQLEVFNSGDPGDEDIDYNCSLVAGSTEITQDPSPALGTLVAGGPSDLINYSCDTAAAGSFSADVECAWSAPIEGAQGTEPYTVTCEVREAFVDVVESPPSGTAQTAELMPGESTTFSFTFDEIIDEGADGSVDCSLATGTDFTITSATGGTVPSGGSLQVDVQFNDPGAGDTFNDTLNCDITDNPDGGEPEVTPVSWPLEVTVVGRNATFFVTKNFDDDNPAEVEVTLSCNTGLPLEQTTTISEGDPVNFVVVDFEPGTMDCDISEVVPVGYTGSYFADIGDDGVAANVFSDEDGCHYEGIESADFICEITNELDAVQVVVNKEWIDDNPSFQLPTTVEIEIFCNEPVTPVAQFAANSEQIDGNGLYSVEWFIDPANPGVFEVFPHWDGSTFCFVEETPEAGVDQDVSDCEDIPLAPGQGGECTIVNTRLYAGIPTLSQYGLILMALLMLGVGAIAFRRYS